ncbi:MAG TPA: M20 family metallopeptidase [Pyrinomonadaceae bacterium]|nr:M20 family metallopeptidase [Pyrinomonadaceae bacterium]
MSPQITDETIRSFYGYFAKREREVLALTRALVETESPSGNEAGSKAVVSLLAAAARGISAVVTIDRIPSENYGEHLRIHAFGNGKTRSKTVLVIGHTDTVHPVGSLQSRPWRVEGNRAYGPGVFDMKANCALAIEAIRCCASLNIKPGRPVVLLLTCDEEAGSLTGRTLVEAEAKRAQQVLVIEPPASTGRVKTGRKGTGMFTLEIHGKAAHAGLEPEKGASAIVEMARQIEHLHRMNNPMTGITVNVGVVRGGTVSNVVAAEAVAEVDLRFSSLEDGRAAEHAILNLKPYDSRVQVVARGSINRPPLERSEKVLELYEHAKRIAAGMDYQLGEAQVGGASDGNFAAAVGAPVLDGLGVDGDGAHAIHEHILIDDIARRGALLAGLLATL